MEGAQLREGSAVSAGLTEVRVQIDSDRDIIEARQRGRELANHAGFGFTDLALIATAISELARNSLRYAIGGEICVRIIEQTSRIGVRIEASDRGPGIYNVTQALQDGFSTSGSLGLGLPGVRRIMDEFEIASEIGRGTTVVATRWRP
jgi:serine/threonine-protein kinase RsbT